MQKRDGKLKVLRPIYTTNAISARMRHFREKAGCVTWQPRQDSDKIKEYMDRRLTRLLGDARDAASIRSLPDLTAAELAELHLPTLGKRANQARPTASAASKKKYVDGMYKRAGKQAPEVVEGAQVEGTEDADDDGHEGD